MKIIVALALLTVTLAQAQVYVPGPQYPLCFPIYTGSGQPTIVCQ